MLVVRPEAASKDFPHIVCGMVAYAIYGYAELELRYAGALLGLACEYDYLYL